MTKPSTYEASVSERLRTLVKQVSEANPNETIHEIAQLVVARTPEDSVIDFYIHAVEHLAREVLCSSRRNIMGGLDAYISQVDGQKSSNPPFRPSPKVEAIRNWWKDFLVEPIYINGKPKQIGDCGFDDLQVCIDTRRKQIKGHENSISNYVKLQALMVENNAKQVKDCPQPKHNFLKK